MASTVGLFENLQNSDFNASDTFSHQTPTFKMNDFGAYLGGPVSSRMCTTGTTRHFSLEASRLFVCRRFTQRLKAFRQQRCGSGNLSAYSDPLTGYPGNIIPTSQLNPFAQKVLNNYYPLPNYGGTNAVANNYLASFNVPINSAQGDVRMDQVITPNQQFYIQLHLQKSPHFTLTRKIANNNPGIRAAGIDVGAGIVQCDDRCA